MPHLSPLYRFSDGFVCGFRFWPNFFAVLRFWMIFSSVLRFLIHPNVPLISGKLHIIILAVGSMYELQPNLIFFGHSSFYQHPPPPLPQYFPRLNATKYQSVCKKVVRHALDTFSTTEGDFLKDNFASYRLTHSHRNH